MGGTTRTLSYGYDANGNRTQITHPDGTRFISSYDGLNRLFLVREGWTTWLNGFSQFASGGGVAIAFPSGSASPNDWCTRPMVKIR